MKKHLLRLEQLATGYSSKRGGKVMLQREMSASLQSGEMIALLGPNGAGKSTLMRTLLGLQDALAGRVFYNHVSLKNLSVRALAKIVAVVLTDGIDDLYLTVNQVVAMGRYLFTPFSGRLSKRDYYFIEKALHDVEMQHFSHQVFFNLSDGEKQKVLIARALVQQTPFIFFDEPAAYIDAPGKIAMMELLKEIVKNQNKGILLTTHDIDLALHYADKCWMLGNGLPFVQGIPEDIVLQNIISQYFQHKGVFFDMRKGKFVSQSKGKRPKIELSGSDIPVLWLAKAFERKGFEVVTVVREKLQFGFYFENNNFVFIKNGKIFNTFNTIEGALKMVALTD